MELRNRDKVLDLSQPQIMGILNVTPDSFSDGGQFQHLEPALNHAEEMIRAGATILDIGGESTRPGATEVCVEQELQRVVPVIAAIRLAYPDIWISVDTSKPEVMTAACEVGADLINDVRALQLPGALEAAAQAGVPVCLMHMKGRPKDMQDAPSYQDVLDDVRQFLSERVQACEKAGISTSQIILDPGFGFGKSPAHNYQLLADIDKLHTLDGYAHPFPILAGMSRKSMIGHVLDKPIEQRLAGSLACAMIALERNAQILRVHDVEETADLVAIFQQLRVVTQN